MPAVKEPVNLMRQDGKCTTLLPWARGKPMAWDVRVAETYAEPHLAATTLTAVAAAADKATANTHIFPVAIETSGVMNSWRLTWSQRLADAI